MQLCTCEREGNGGVNASCQELSTGSRFVEFGGVLTKLSMIGEFGKRAEMMWDLVGRKVLPSRQRLELRH